MKNSLAIPNLQSYGQSSHLIKPAKHPGLLEKKFTSLLSQAGIIVNGSKPWDIQIHSDRIYRALILGNLAFGEDYMDKYWDCEQLDEFFYRLLSAGLDSRGYVANILVFAKFMLMNTQKLSRANEVGRRHYDLGNDLFRSMLDPYMQYSCGYWANDAADLEQAQRQKLDLICRKIDLHAGDRVLDIGCGWGGFAKYAASEYGAKVVGTTISKEQAEYARELCQGLPVEILLEDYREYQGKFDKIVSVGMFEHVGHKNYKIFMEMADRALKNNGVFLLHTIVGKSEKVNVDPWMEKYIFPNGSLPSIKQIMGAAKNIFVSRDAHEFGAYYDKTLMAWWQNFNTAWKELKNNPKYDETFYRMWHYYLLSCAGSFRAKKIQLWQIVLTKINSELKNYFPAR